MPDDGKATRKCGAVSRTIQHRDRLSWGLARLRPEFSPILTFQLPRRNTPATPVATGWARAAGSMKSPVRERKSRHDGKATCGCAAIIKVGLYPIAVRKSLMELQGVPNSYWRKSESANTNHEPTKHRSCRPDLWHVRGYKHRPSRRTRRRDILLLQ